VDVNDLQGVSVDYSSLGYRHVSGLCKRDVKWLIEAFGEPARHQTLAEIWPAPMQNAISRYCWENLNSANETARAIRSPEEPMPEYLRRHLKIQLSFYPKRNEAAVRAVSQVLLDGSDI
jgi:hypothetical protein